jgi:hypothetical protein
MNDAGCAAFVQSAKFKSQFEEILQHDKEIFDEPFGWTQKTINESPLITDFASIWSQLKSIYKRELSALAYSPIPDEKQIAKQFTALIKNIK